MDLGRSASTKHYVNTRLVTVLIPDSPCRAANTSCCILITSNVNGNGFLSFKCSYYPASVVCPSRTNKDLDGTGKMFRAQQTRPEAAPRIDPLPATEPINSSMNWEKTVAGQDSEVAQSNENPAVDPCPDGGYGWVCVACCFWINAHTWGINSSYGVFLAFYLDNNYYPGASALDFAFVGGLSVSMALLISPIATTTTRLYGTNVTLLIGVFFETLALIGASFAHRIWQLFLSQGACFGWGMGYLFVGSVRRDHGSGRSSADRS